MKSMLGYFIESHQLTACTCNAWKAVLAHQQQTFLLHFVMDWMILTLPYVVFCLIEILSTINKAYNPLLQKAKHREALPLSMNSATTITINVEQVVDNSVGRTFLLKHLGYQSKSCFKSTLIAPIATKLVTHKNVVSLFMVICHIPRLNLKLM